MNQVHFKFRASKLSTEDEMISHEGIIGQKYRTQTLMDNRSV